MKIDFVCVVCGEETHDAYMLKKEVWEGEGKLGRYQNLHLKCVEEHLGRNLTVDDFTSAPINALLKVGIKIAINMMDDSVREVVDTLRLG